MPPPERAQVQVQVREPQQEPLVQQPLVLVQPLLDMLVLLLSKH
jgi:hypothetical protein